MGRWKALIQTPEARARGLGEARVFMLEGEPTRSALREQLSEWVNGRIAAGDRNFVAAGGDGTVQRLVDVLAGHPEVVVGAVGLGSSNDFHKPRLGPPVRLDFEKAQLRDIGEFRCETGATKFVVGVSVGITGVTNAGLHRPPGLHLKKISADLASAIIGLGAIARFRGFGAELRVDGKTVDQPWFYNLQVIKGSYFVGEFRYDQVPGDGELALHWVGRARRREMLRMMMALRGGRFSECPGAHSQMIRRMEVRLPSPQSVEVDGEIFEASNLEILIHPRALKVCP